MLKLTSHTEFVLNTVSATNRSRIWQWFPCTFLIVENTYTCFNFSWDKFNLHSANPLTRTLFRVPSDFRVTGVPPAVYPDFWKQKNQLILLFGIWNNNKKKTFKGRSKAFIWRRTVSYSTFQRILGRDEKTPFREGGRGGVQKDWIR